MQTLAPCASSPSTTCFEGQPLNAPNDLTARSDGVIYFTDPNFGNETEGFPAETRPLADAQGVYRLDKDGTLHVEDVTAVAPNGVNLSPDEKTLYVSYTLDGSVAKFDVATDGSLADKQSFITGVVLPDGMCVDAGGNVYVGTAQGLAIYDAAGNAIGTISPTRPAVTNCAFGGPDQRTLFITAYAHLTPSAGDAGLFKIDEMPIPGMAGRNRDADSGNGRAQLSSTQSSGSGCGAFRSSVTERR
jgi:gluconolactonase